MKKKQIQSKIVFLAKFCVLVSLLGLIIAPTASAISYSYNEYSVMNETNETVEIDLSGVSSGEYVNLDKYVEYDELNGTEKEIIDNALSGETNKMSLSNTPELFTDQQTIGIGKEENTYIINPSISTHEEQRGGSIFAIVLSLLIGLALSIFFFFLIVDLLVIIGWAEKTVDNDIRLTL